MNELIDKEVILFIDILSTEDIELGSTIRGISHLSTPTCRGLRLSGTCLILIHELEIIRFITFIRIEWNSITENSIGILRCDVEKVEQSRRSVTFGSIASMESTIQRLFISYPITAGSIPKTFVNNIVFCLELRVTILPSGDIVSIETTAKFNIREENIVGGLHAEVIKLRMIEIKGSEITICNITAHRGIIDNRLNTCNSNKFEDEVKALSKEILIARDLLTNGLYHSPEESIIKFLLTP
ncbi:MAG: hypothetical protein HDS75_06085 [Bacteroidales bacterium]|nr:hypothetical protein [Bacteroidales bacterium]